MRRVAYEAADSGLLSPELAAGIRRVKGVRRLGVPGENWLTGERVSNYWQAQAGIRCPAREITQYWPMLIGRGLRRGELLTLHKA